MLSMIGIAMWPVFLIQLRDVWSLTNTEIGWISGVYFCGYVIATPILVGLTDAIDSKSIFLIGCASSFLGCIGFAFLADDFWSASITWAFVGAGLAGTYMPGLQILNARLDDSFRIRAVPWYTSSFGLGTGLSFSVMGFMLTYSSYQSAALLGALGALVAGVVVLLFVEPKSIAKPSNLRAKRHPLDLRPAFRKPKAMSYILAYSAHTYELFAFRSWSFALFVFLGSNSNSSISVANIASIFGFLTILGLIASTTGAKICLTIGRHRALTLIAGFTVLLAVSSAIMLGGPLWLSMGLLCVYNVAIMFDSGGLTAGTVSESEPHDRGALLAVHSMIGFTGGAIGAPVIGYVLDVSGGELKIEAWSYAILAMAIGSLVAFFIQLKFLVFRKS